ncbi:hypothetical protein BC828DRAFT_382060 [Blastocladiella britannica]|nr:hypothetical protein BC828DRAFT_382060 [Blastocladiella britannica]
MWHTSTKLWPVARIVLGMMGLAATAVVVIHAAAPSCGTKARVRKEIRDLTDSEFAAWTEAMNTMKKSGQFTQYVAVHQQFTLPAHFGVLFLAWHRRFIWQFETDVLAITGDRLKGIPYFDPFMSYGIFDPKHPRYIGEANGCILTGPFKGWWSAEGACVQRTMGMTPPTFVDPRAITQLAMADAAFSDYATSYENTQHADVHTAIGGQMATLQFSTNDVAFWLHHAHVDQVWWARQYANNQARFWDYSGTHTPGGVGQVTLNTPIPPWQDPVGSVVDTYSTMCVDYMDPQSALAAPPVSVLTKRDLAARGPGATDPHAAFKIFAFDRSMPLVRCTPLSAERLAPLGQTVERMVEGCKIVNAVIDAMEREQRPHDEWPMMHDIVREVHTPGPVGGGTLGTWPRVNKRHLVWNSTTTNAAS